jgi:hypothetical protein
MSEWLTFVKAYALKNNIPYKQALTAASPSYKTRNEIKADVPPPPETPTPKRKYIKKVKSNIS